MVTQKKSSYYVQCIHLLGARFNPINHCEVFTSENMTPDVHPKPSRGFEWKEMTFYTNEEDFMGKACVEIHFIKLNVTHTGSVWDTSYRPHHCFLCEPTYSTCSVLMCVIVGWYTADLSSAMTHLSSPEKKNKNISSHLKNYTARLSVPWLLPLLVGCSQCVLMRMERRTENAAAGYVALNGVNTQNKQISHIYVNKNYLAQGTMNVLSFEPGCKTCCTRQ